MPWTAGSGEGEGADAGVGVETGGVFKVDLGQRSTLNVQLSMFK
jgi:hypothetical protein